MRTNMLYLLAGAFALTALISSPTRADDAADIAAIDSLYASWRKAVERADIPAYVGVLDADVRLLPPDADPIVGAAKYGEFLGPVFAAADYRIEVVRSPVIEIHGDLALAEYDYVIHLQLKDAEVGVRQPGALTAERTAARYIDVLRRQPGGGWAVYRHAWQNKTASN
jgi:ketosteroid isomerase-like protein